MKFLNDSIEKNKLHNIFPLLTLLLLIPLSLVSCSEGGIVGTGDTEATIDPSGDLGSDPASVNDVDSEGNKKPHQNQNLPQTITPPFPQALLHRNDNVVQSSIEVLQNNFNAVQRRSLEIHLELLYLDAAYDAIANFCTGVDFDQVCELNSNNISVSYTTEVALAEQEILQAKSNLVAGTLSKQVVDEALVGEKVGSPIPLGSIEFSRFKNGEFLTRLKSVRSNQNNNAIELSIDWSSNSSASRIIYQRESSTESEIQKITSWRYFDRSQFTERSFHEGSFSNNIFLLSTLLTNDVEAEIFIQADYRELSKGNYQHILWDGKASINGAYLSNRTTSAPGLMEATSAERFILQPNGTLDASERCVDNIAADLCGDDSSQWHELQTSGSSTVSASDLFTSSENLEAWKNGLSTVKIILTVDDPQIESVVVTAGDDSTLSVLDNSLCAASRVITGAPFRSYCWNTSINIEESKVFQEAISDSGLVFNLLSEQFFEIESF